jgi:hypothetical protein
MSLPAAGYFDTRLHREPNPADILLGYYSVIAKHRSFEHVL